MQHVLIIHGWGNTRAEDHWQRHLAVSLRGAGQQVYYPQLPDTDLPSFEKWSAVLIAELEMIAANRRDGDEVVVIAHSLGCSTWLRLATDGLLPLTADRLLLVAPAEPDMLEDVASFQIRPNDIVATALKASSESVTMLGSDADSWSPRGIVATYGEPLQIEPIVWPGVKHLALADGFGRWQGVIDWVANPQAELTVR
jgi:hypothetical protein